MIIIHKYSYSDYLSWGEEDRWEIIDGVSYLHSPTLRIHQRISFNLSLQFGKYLENKECEVYAAPFCVRLGIEKDENNIRTVVEPDISIICDKSKLDEKGCAGSPDLIVEIVSPTSAQLDKINKFNKYEEAKVKEYWIVEPDQKIISVFKLGSDGRYGRPDIYSEKDKVKVSIFEDLEIDLAFVFR